MTLVPLNGSTMNQIAVWRILGEGESESTYFDELKRYLSTVTFRTDDAKGGDLANVWRLSGKKLKEGLKIVVMDIDNNDPEELREFRGWCDQNRINLIISNPSIEVWLLMHFKDVSSNMDQDDLEGGLSKALGHEYQKRKGIRPTRRMVSEASVRARKKIPRDGDPFEFVLTHPGNTMMPIIFDIVGEDVVVSK
jgi:hypothetical protein